MRFSRSLGSVPVAGLVVVALVAVLAGCGPTAPVPESTDSAAPTPSVTPSETPTPTPTPTPTQAAETGFVQPRQVFDGDCSAIFSTAELTELAGSGLTLRHTGNPLALSFDYLAPQAGAVTCTWANKSFTSGLSFVVLPEASAVDPDPASGCGEIESGSVSCAFDATENALRISGRIFSGTASKSALKAKAHDVEALFTDHASALTDVTPAPIPADGAWPMPLDCAAVARDVDFGAVFGVTGKFSGGESGGFGADYVEKILWPGLVWPRCGVWNREANKDVIYSIVGGGRWAEESIASTDGAVRRTVAGVDAVYEIPSVNGKIIHMFDGVNWLVIDNSTSRGRAVGVAIIDYLNGE
jgi:hypothetical protein